MNIAFIAVKIKTLKNTSYFKLETNKPPVVVYT